MDRSTCVCAGSPASAKLLLPACRIFKIRRMANRPEDGVPLKATSDRRMRRRLGDDKVICLALTGSEANPTVSPRGVGSKEYAPLKVKLSGLRPFFGLAVAGLLMFSLVALPSYTAHAQGQGIALIRDTEAERVLRAKLDPILVTAGLVPKDVQLHLVNDPSINAFVAEGQHMFINTGLLMSLETPNQITGVMAHETGHMAHGDLVRAAAGMKAATLPMLLSMAAGLAAMIAGVTGNKPLPESIRQALSSALTASRCSLRK